MPQNQEHRTKPNQRVRIKDEVTHMYDHARAYNEAVVKRQMHDNLGYPLIYIEWDKDHWAYSGEPDRWALEAHFDPVEEKMADSNSNDKFQDLLKGLSNLVANYQNEDEPVAEAPEDTRPQTEEELTYEYVLQKGVEDALKGEGFLLFVASNQMLGNKSVVVPLLYMHSKGDDGALMVDAAAADHVAHSAQRLIQDRIARQDGTSSS